MGVSGSAEAPECWVKQEAVEPQGEAQPQRPATHSQERPAQHRLLREHLTRARLAL